MTISNTAKDHENSNAATTLEQARDAWRDAFYLVTGVRDGGYAPLEIRAQAVENAVKRAKELDARV